MPPKWPLDIPAVRPSQSRESNFAIPCKSQVQLQRFVSIHDPIANLFHLPRHEMPSTNFREMRLLAIQICHDIAHVNAA